VTRREDSADLRFAFRQGDYARLSAKDREPVAFERAQIFRTRQQGFFGQQLTQLPDQPGEVTDRMRRGVCLIRPVLRRRGHALLRT
jgi:hypothetical protein